MCLIRQLPEIVHLSLSGDVGAIVRRVRVSQAVSVGQSAVSRSSSHREARCIQPTAVRPAETQTGQRLITHLRLHGPSPRIRRTTRVVSGRNSHGPSMVSAHRFISAAALLWSGYFLINLMMVVICNDRRTVHIVLPVGLPSKHNSTYVTITFIYLFISVSNPTQNTNYIRPNDTLWSCEQL